MKEGYWINYRTGKVLDVREHEEFIRTPGNAQKLGIPANVISAFSNFKPVQDRDRFLLFILKNAPVMRARGHGSYISFEYASHDRQDVMDAVLTLGGKIAGPFTQLYIVNFSTNESIQMSFKEFEDLMEQGADAVMRAASVQSFRIKAKIVRELLAISKELLK